MIKSAILFRCHWNSIMSYKSANYFVQNLKSVRNISVTTVNKRKRQSVENVKSVSSQIKISNIKYYLARMWLGLMLFNKKTILIIVVSAKLFLIVKALELILRCAEQRLTASPIKHMRDYITKCRVFCLQKKKAAVFFVVG